MAQYRYFAEGQFKVDPTTGTKCRTGQLNHQFVEQKFVGGAWVGIGDNDGVRYGDVAGAGCRFREGMRDGDYVVDVELEVAGFLLAEGDGWENIGGAQGNWNQQLIDDSCLFFAGNITNVLNKVAATHLPNQVTGAVDYLTVTGLGLDARYRTPDSDTYRTADLDYVFWKTDTSESICDGNRLIDYDFPRILVKYLNIAPYTILWIAILKPGVTVTNQIFTAFHLPLFWSGVENIYGVIKGNRGFTQNVWTPELLYGNEKIQNGTFDNNSHWINGSSVELTFSNGKVNYGALTVYGVFWQNDLVSNIVSGESYKLEYDISGSAAQAGCFFANAGGVQIFTEYADYTGKANGHHIETIHAVANSTTFSLYCQFIKGSFSVDNLSLMKIL